MRRAQYTVQVGPCHYEGPRCPCGNYLCRPVDDPYCPKSALFVGRRASVEPPADARSLSAEYLAAWDRMAEFHRAEARRRAGGEVSIEGGAGLRDPGGDTCGVAPVGIPDESAPPATPSDLDSPTPAPRRKRRNKQEMQEFRAAKQRQITESYNSLVPAETREWLDEPDPLVDAILSGPHDPQA